MRRAPSGGGEGGDDRRAAHSRPVSPVAAPAQATRAGSVAQHGGAALPGGPLPSPPSPPPLFLPPPAHAAGGGRRRALSPAAAAAPARRQPAAEPAVFGGSFGGGSAMSDSPSASFAGPAAAAFGGSFGAAAAAGAGDPFGDAAASSFGGSFAGPAAAAAAAAGAGAGRLYGPGTYGYRRSEQARLGARYGQPVSGASHEAEHPLAAESVRQLRGAATRAEVEQPLPAYQEAREVHRLHAGTGTGRKLRADGSAFETGWSSAEQYRSDQLTALRGGDVSTALQLQSLGIAFARQNAGLANTPYNQVRLAQAEDSYQHMLAHMGVGGAAASRFPVSPAAVAEAGLAHQAAQTGQWPSRADFTAAWAQASGRWRPGGGAA